MELMEWTKLFLSL